MKKILLILNEIRPPTDVLDYAISIAQAHRSFLQGIFLKQSEHVIYQYLFPNDFPLTEVKGSQKDARKEDVQLLSDYIRLFKDKCEAAGIAYQIMEDDNSSLAQLIHYSLFADYIIADARVDLDQFSLQDVLVDTHCPVILVKSDCQPAEKVVLTFNGSASSI